MAGSASTPKMEARRAYWPRCVGLKMLDDIAHAPAAGRTAAEVTLRSRVSGEDDVLTVIREYAPHGGAMKPMVVLLMMVRSMSS